MSLDDSREMVRRLGVRYDEIPIQPAMKVFGELLAPQFLGLLRTRRRITCRAGSGA